MATVYPTAAGAWSTRTWIDDSTGAAYGAGTPQPGDIVLLNGCAINIDIDIAVASIRPHAGTYALTGGLLTPTGTRIITADLYGGESAAGPTYLITMGSGEIRGNCYGGSFSGKSAFYINQAAKLVGHCYGGSAQYAGICYFGAKIYGNCYAGSSNSVPGALVGFNGVLFGDTYGSDLVGAWGATISNGARHIGDSFGGNGGAAATGSYLDSGWQYGNATGGTAIGSKGTTVNSGGVAIIHVATGTFLNGFGILSFGKSVVIVSNTSGAYPLSLSAETDTTFETIPFAERSGGIRHPFISQVIG